MIWDLIREFVALSNEGSVLGERLKRAIRLMCELRGYGFSSRELEVQSGGKWDESTIRGHWRDSTR